MTFCTCADTSKNCKPVFTSSSPKVSVQMVDEIPKTAMRIMDTTFHEFVLKDRKEIPKYSRRDDQYDSKKEIAIQNFFRYL